jgi:caffeoyl-CoA O-methyltransferase
MSIPKNAIAKIVNPDISQYLSVLAGDPEPLVLEMEAYARQKEFPLVGRSSGRWLELLTKMIGARRVFEFGSGYGFSAYWFARAVGEDGTVIGSEKDQHELDMHLKLFVNSPYLQRIDLRHGDAFQVFRKTEGPFDVVFIDIHKQGYVQALEAALPRVRPGGLILADNVLWGGRTAQPAAEDDEGTMALQEYNRRIMSEPELQSMVLPVGDGLAVSWKVGGQRPARGDREPDRERGPGRGERGGRRGPPEGPPGERGGPGGGPGGGGPGGGGPGGRRRRD